jgi:hypothetical protein
MTQVVSVRPCSSAAYNTWSEQALRQCVYCSRSFTDEAFKSHAKSCTSKRPARRVGDVHKVGPSLISIFFPAQVEHLLSRAIGGTTQVVSERSRLHLSKRKYCCMALAQGAGRGRAGADAADPGDAPSRGGQDNAAARENLWQNIGG